MLIWSHLLFIFFRLPPAPSPPPAKPSHGSEAKLKPPNKLTRPGSTPPSNRVHAHQVHPNQPSPSPSQLNNPSIYTSPPPTLPNRPYNYQQPAGAHPPRPSSSQGSTPSFPMPTISGHPTSAYNPQLHIPTWQGQQSTPAPTPQKPILSASTVVAGLLDKIRR